VRVPDEFAKSADAQVIVRIESQGTGKIEASRKLADLPKPTQIPRVLSR